MKLCEEVLHVNDMPFRASTSEHLRYGTTSPVDSMKCETLELEIQNAVRCYGVQLFRIFLLIEDAQFKNLKYCNNIGAHISIVTRGEHIIQI